ncbi:hypothetical protein BO71DRAFT_403767 [Aspergillus ellipticus CBS 707.79]|uniref:Peptidase metallopeptidase domain-containing protein n=1 Tax=Aspergillus ellipticus CBS 707.79 TaxID=1448320 RepID=A0A319CVN5_9EURO|nr:hypothetical protein BO71DRAFT_403767 [Aspergillus ellipticus CBS 707.79]
MPPVWMWAAMLLSMLLALLPGVQAGHPVWENARFDSPDWIVRNPYIEGNNKLWPFKTIPVCFETRAVMHKYYISFHAAMDLWYAAGLPEAFMLFFPSDEACQALPYETVLVRDVPTGNLMSAELGHPPIIAGRTEHNFPAPGAPALYLAMPAIQPYDDFIADLAHLLGHVFGLGHEHQDPKYARRLRVPRRTRSVFDFHCANLPHYDEMQVRFGGGEGVYGPVGVCVNFGAAVAAGFEAAQWLPYPPNTYVSSDDLMADPDLYSIMLYDTFRGGQDERPVLKLRDGDRNIDKNKVPSGKDVEGLVILYNFHGTQDRLPFFNDPESPYYGDWRQYADCM